MLSNVVSLRDEIAVACDGLREADRLHAVALGILVGCDVEARRGLPTEMVLMLDARRTGSDARMLTDAASVLRGMPFTMAAMQRGDISWAQVRAICLATKLIDVAGRASLDGSISLWSAELRDGDPDVLIARVDEAVARLRADLLTHREDRSIKANFLSIQGRFDGGSSIYGEADAGSTATILEALDAAADAPRNADDEDAPTRAQQRMEALVSVCEQSLNGGHAGTTRPRPRLIAAIDLDAFASEGLSEGARVLWNLLGRAPRLSPVTTETLLCDASVQPVYFQGARPIHVGDAKDLITAKQRIALIARDGGCRFPTCGAPVSWCDAHHVRARVHEGPTNIDNLVLLCRRCHRRVHRYRWKITMNADGTITFQRRGESHPSHPRGRPPPRE